MEAVKLTSIKFLCSNCNGIVLTDYGDEMVQCGHCDMPCNVPEPFSYGMVIDDFLILEKIGSGGMGDVYKAHQISLDRQVALKILHGRFLEKDTFKSEFIYEARSVASLNHKNIVQAYKVGEDCGVLFFAMEHVEGKALNDYLKECGRFDEGTARAIGINIAAAIGYAWEKCQLVHRDIKPENIMVATNGDVKLMDLGLSRKDGDDFDDEDRISGTLQYISPEQIVGGHIDFRSDLYCLGATLYHLITGRYVFNSDNAMEMLEKHIGVEPPSVREFSPEITVGFERMISKLLEKKADKRYQSIQSLINDLQKVENDAPVKMRLTRYKDKRLQNLSIKEPIVKDQRYKLAVVGLIAFFVLGIIAAVIIVKSSVKKELTVENQNDEALEVIEEDKGGQGSQGVEDNAKIFAAQNGLVMFFASSFNENLTQHKGVTWSFTKRKDGLIGRCAGQKFVPGKAAILRYKIKAETDGGYHIWLNGKIKNNTTNPTIRLFANGNPVDISWQKNNENAVKWRKLNGTLNLVDGINNLEIHTSAPGTVLKKIALGADLSAKDQLKNFQESPQL